jgi:hypothetical protein
MIHGVVVNERREVHELHDRGEGEGVFVGTVPDLAREKEERGAEKLPTHLEEVIVHLLLDLEVRVDDPADLLDDAVEPFPHGLLDAGKPRRCTEGSGGSFVHDRSVRDGWTRPDVTGGP